jgi:glycine/D-amino acid oxidase-like deaminating enzyme
MTTRDDNKKWIVMIFHFLILTSCAFRPDSRRSISTSSSSSSLLSSISDVGVSLECDPSLEIVGASGRMGSFFLRHGERSMAVPRGVVPGSLSKSGTPILVTIPSQHWKSIHDMTERTEDIVWIGNGLLSNYQQNSTTIIPHFGILMVNADPTTSSSDSGKTPPTFVYGKHATQMMKLLSQSGIKQIQYIDSWEIICKMAVRKLLWASCLWLLCHNSDPPLTVAEVHIQNETLLKDLVQELFPILLQLSGNTNETLSDLMFYMKSYSLSMPNAIPSKQLAIQEWNVRNGVFYRPQQKLHTKLLKQIQKGDNNDDDTSIFNFIHEPKDTDMVPKQHLIPLPDSKLVCWGQNVTNQQQKRDIKSIIVIGGGIIGSSIARSLKRKNPAIHVTVIDPTPFGLTTPASWAWINANNKSPPSYKFLNQLGMRSWRMHPLYNQLPEWKGSLVCYPTPQETIGGGYSCEGPLSEDRIQELEPNAKFTNGYVYHFPDEGFVDPCFAVKALREGTGDANCCEDNSHKIHMISNQRVVELIRDTTDRVIGVKTETTDNSTNDGDISNGLYADVVVIAAGIGCSNTAFAGGVPLRRSFGQISFARPTATNMDTSNVDKSSRLEKLLVDTVRESHILQRNDGWYVAGGGILEVGGKSNVTSNAVTGTPTSSETRLSNQLWERTQSLVPNVWKASKFLHVQEAIRPMPLDGLPVVGYLEDGLYVVVTHSGVTLAPILGQLAAVELLDNMAMEVLREYRPSRLIDSKIHNDYYK